ncbi:MAG: hypothetical protein IRZ28_13795 [Steroidobacteraceae bacterium]|nr:hypothetical protein [Steroidobacteraceae bacterium]
MNGHRTPRSAGRIGTMLCAVLLACVGACGGDTRTGGIQGSGSPVASSAVGAITGFGSIFVNGIEYGTSGAQISIDDEAGTEALLRVGQIVTVRGTLNEDGVTGSATSVAYITDVRGPVAQVDATAGTFRVLGQTVRVTDETLFDENIPSASLDGLANGMVVEVSGFPDASGAILASRVDLSAAGAVLQVKGVVQELDTAFRTFRLNDLTVDYRNVAPDATLADGKTVVVRGNLAPGTERLEATRVQLQGPTATANERGRLSGVITSFTSQSDFTVNGQRITTDANTQFVLHGTTLAANVFVNVQGTFDASGVLVASRVEAKPKSSSRVRGIVEDVSAASNTLRVLGVTATANASTSFRDKSSEHLRTLRLADLRTGDYVEIRGTPREGGGLDAAVIERDRPEQVAYLQGVAENVAEPSFTVLGVRVATTPDTQFPDGGASRFFSEAPGQVVKVRGTLQSDAFVADRVQIVRSAP